jgi:hypothetical protein
MLLLLFVDSRQQLVDEKLDITIPTNRRSYCIFSLCGGGKNVLNSKEKSSTKNG